MKDSLVKAKHKTLFNRINNYWRSNQYWLQKTPERALDQAYEAALKIRAIEEEHFNGEKVSVNSSLYTKNIIDCFLNDINSNLNIIKIRITEFKVSRNIFKFSETGFLDKLRFIDKISNKYEDDDDNLAIILQDNSQPIIVKVNNKKEQNSTLTPLDFLEVQNSQQVGKKTGVLPRSIGRTIQKIKTELDDKSEQTLMDSYRVSRKKTKAAINFALMLIIIPLLTQQLSKQLLFNHLVDRFRTPENTPIFLNYEMKEEALRELQTFEEELKFESLLHHTPKLTSEEIETKVTEKANELAEEFHFKSNRAVSNVFADFTGLIGFALVVGLNQKGLNALKSLLNSIIYDLSDSAKAFIIILCTDIFVGFHSPHGWEVILEGIANHFGIAPNHSYIFLFIATFPVILDTIMKYWIFRYLNQISPSAVATLKNMNE